MLSHKISNAFNDFFCDVGHKFATNFDESLPNIEQLMPKGSFTIPHVSKEFLKKEIKSMSSSKATGIDEISVKMLKVSIDAVADILCLS